MKIFDNRCNDKRALRLCKRLIIVWITSVAFWILDRTCCNILIKINLNYFHSIFHVLAIISAQWTVTMFLYFTAIDKVPHLDPVISYWKENEITSYNVYNVFIPYVKFTNSNKKFVTIDKDEINDHKITEILYKSS